MNEIEWLKETFAVCRLPDRESLPHGPFCFSAETDEEISLVCPQKTVPENAIACDKGWRGFRIKGVLDFSLIGILARISAILAEASIGIFVISTYNTDYVFVKEENVPETDRLLRDHGYHTEGQ